MSDQFKFDEEQLTDDEYVVTYEWISSKQIESMNRILALPWKELDFNYDEDENSRV